MSDDPAKPVSPAIARRARNRRIAAARDRGVPVKMIAQNESISERQVRRGELEARQEAGLVIDIDPDDALREVLAVHRWGLERMAALADSGNHAAAVGAIKGRVEISTRMLDLLVLAGVVPSSDQATMRRVEREHRRFVSALFDVLDSRGVAFADLETDLDRVLMERRAITP